MPVIPEFLLRKLIVKNSIQTRESGFSFEIYNTIAPATLQNFSLQVDGRPVPKESIKLVKGLNPPVDAESISPEEPYPLAVGDRVTVRVAETDLGEGNLRISFLTREGGELSFSLKSEKHSAQKAKRPFTFTPFRLFHRPLKTEVNIDFDAVTGEVNPNIYGQFVEHLEQGVYGGIWTADGSELRQDTLALVKELQPPLIRYPGGNFASGYHWEDGIGPIESRPERYDEAWQSVESNRVGTGEFMDFCRQVGADPFLVVNTGNGTPEEAARWVAYCNEPPSGEQGSRRAANGHPEPYNVRLWGIGNEVWGQWQIGHTHSGAYTRTLRAFAEAMRAVDPDIQIVAVGDKVMSDSPDDPGALWNQAVLSGAGDIFDFLSFHIYQPDQSGWQEEYDHNALHHTICAAPLDVANIIQRIADQIRSLAPDREIGIALDEWNLWLPPPEDADSMHQVRYTMRDALYTAGMLNVFHRQGHLLKIANLAQLVNVLPLILAEPDMAYATPIYYPFLIHRQMEPVSLHAEIRGKYYDSLALGNIPAMHDVPYIDVAASRNTEGSRAAVCIINRHPNSRSFVDIELKNFPEMKLAEGWLMRHDDLSAYNSKEEPDLVQAKKVSLPEKRGGRFRLDLPPASVSILKLNKEI